ncbi:cold-shock protein [Paenibacillus faecalis]|uniref:cold-shock protein n=1 Tax=Paenibacillus faecalis TaxID=2079532 RepID=UPI000D0EF58E|nr:cold-shock protein [Paenibacillus faecalis]
MYSRKNAAESIPEEMTEVWSCTNKDCKGWIRDDFAFEIEPDCMLCQSPMVKETRMLPLLVNSNNKKKR